MTIEITESQPVVAASRFLLRPLRTSDAGLIGLYTADERVARMTSRIPHPLPPGLDRGALSRRRACPDGPRMSGRSTAPDRAGRGPGAGLAQAARPRPVRDRLLGSAGVLEHRDRNRGGAGARHCEPAPVEHALRACLPGQPGLGTGADELRIRLPGRRRILLGRAAGGGADLDLLAPHGLTAGAGSA